MSRLAYSSVTIICIAYTGVKKGEWIYQRNGQRPLLARLSAQATESTVSTALSWRPRRSQRSTARVRISFPVVRCDVYRGEHSDGGE